MSPASLDALQKRLGHRFSESGLLQRALTHRSFGADHNERLEFLGDAVLSLAVSSLLFERFAGSVVDISLKAPVGAAAQGLVSANRKKFRGTLERIESGGVAGWQIVWRDEPAVKPGQRVSRKRVPAPLQALGFTLDEVREVRLAPVVDFKGRRFAAPVEAPTEQVESAGNEMDGDRKR